MASIGAQRDVTATGLFSAGLGLLQRQWRVLLALALVSAVLQALQKFEIASQIGGVGGVAVTVIVVSILGFVASATFIRMVLSYEGLVTSDAPTRYLTFLGTGIVMGVGYVIGLVLLVVPGIIILLRWLLAPNFVLAQDMGVSDALKASRDATSGHRWAIFWALVLAGLVVAIPVGVLVVAAGGFQAYSALPWNSTLGIASIVVGALYGMFFNAINLGIFMVLSGGADRFDEVFG